MATIVEFENDRVRVFRMTHAAHEKHPHATRHDRLIIYLDEGTVVRTVSGTPETLKHKAGDVVWRDHSKHQIENLTGDRHEVIIVEIK